MVVYDGHREGLMASARVWWMFRVSSLSFSPLLMASIHCAILLLSFNVRSSNICCVKLEMLSIAATHRADTFMLHPLTCVCGCTSMS